MNFMTVVADTILNASLDVSKSDVSTPDRLYLSQNRLFPDYITNLDNMGKDLEQLISELDLHKSRIEDTYQRFTNYSQDSEERQLSSEIFNTHFGHFKEVFVKFLEYIKDVHLTTPSGDPKPKAQFEAVKTANSSEESNISAC